jgi:hypothetical protein
MEQVDLTKVLFLDIETVSAYRTFEEQPEYFQELWRHRSRQWAQAADSPEEDVAAILYREKAGIFAEFGKIVCISVGILLEGKNGEGFQVRLKSFAGDDEAALLQDFYALLQERYPDPRKHYLCGHNIKEFDIPYLCRRMVVHQLPFPALMDLSGKKPWETLHLLDTMEYWKFGDKKSYTSLKLLAALLDFPSPKDDIDGSQVGRVYYEENDLSRISFYCEKDVLATIQLVLRFRRMPILESGQVTHVGREA